MHHLAVREELARRAWALLVYPYNKMFINA
jgi:hypothetical protein